MAKSVEVEVIGVAVKALRPMTQEEMDAEGWEITGSGVPTVVELENGVKFYPSMDPEGNGAGCLYGLIGDHRFYA